MKWNISPTLPCRTLVVLRILGIHIIFKVICLHVFSGMIESGQVAGQSNSYISARYLTGHGYLITQQHYFKLHLMHFYCPHPAGARILLINVQARGYDDKTPVNSNPVHNYQQSQIDFFHVYISSLQCIVFTDGIHRGQY